MDYQKHYSKLIQRAKTRVLEGYQEQHHILPRCLGGNDNSENIVSLTAEEHYVAHQLLVKMYPGNKGLIYAAKMMTVGSENNQRSNNKLYGWLRKKFVEAHSERCKGVVFSEESRRKMSLAKAGKTRGKYKPRSSNNKNKGQSLSIDHKQKLSIAAKTRKRRILSQEARQNMSRAQKLACEQRNESYKYNEEYRALQSLRAKEAWARRKDKGELSSPH